MLIVKDAASDYRERNYLSVVEVSAYTGLPVREIHQRVKSGELASSKSASGQYRFELLDIVPLRKDEHQPNQADFAQKPVEIDDRGSRQVIIRGDSRDMSGDMDDESVHLAITSPPYFNAKMYSELSNDLGNIHDLDEWFAEIGKAWGEVFRVLQPGRKFFLNIMNLPVREKKTFRSLNLVGKSIDLCESVGFVFKRDVVWHKTNGVRAHFGTYPYPGSILINHMHEFILEFEKPMKRQVPKYAHVSDAQREASKLDKDFWLYMKNSDVWLMKPEKSGGNRNHAAPFPLELPARLIKAYSFIGETVIDPFIGSGTTLVAAATHGRNGVGYDINSEFCAIAEKRLKEVLI